MKEIPLSLQGKNKRCYVALVDDDDYDLLTQHRWSLNNSRYAVTFNGSHILMHRLIMNCPKDMVVDHINNNGLDNRKCNLRICTAIENHYNTKIHVSNKTGFKGVSLHKMSNKFEVRIRFNGKKLHIGLFDDKEEAAKAYDLAAKSYHKQFARLNNI